MDPVAVTRVDSGDTDSILIPKISEDRTTESPTAIEVTSRATRSTTVEAVADVEIDDEFELIAKDC
jgi:hypothetical protein